MTRVGGRTSWSTEDEERRRRGEEEERIVCVRLCVVVVDVKIKCTIGALTCNTDTVLYLAAFCVIIAFDDLLLSAAATATAAATTAAAVPAPAPANANANANASGPRRRSAAYACAAYALALLAELCVCERELFVRSFVSSLFSSRSLASACLNCLSLGLDTNAYEFIQSKSSSSIQLFN